jgi:hypothetical protein
MEGGAAPANMGLTEGANQSNFCDGTSHNETKYDFQHPNAAAEAHLESLGSVSRQGNKSKQCRVGCVGNSDHFGHANSSWYNDQSRLHQCVSGTAM